MGKDSDSAITPVAEVVCVPAHLAPPGSPQARQLHHLHAHQLSPGQSCHRQKKSRAYARRVTPVVSNSLRSCRLWPARLLCQGGSPGKNTGVYWPILVVISFQSTIFPAALAINAPEYAETQAAAPPSHLALTGANPNLPGQKQTPVDDLHAEVEIKPQLKPRGSAAKEEDPKPSHQLYKLQIKVTSSTR